ncbi:MAG: tetratricopeptide repeat protein [Isosphaeraceae bacterium]
MRRFAWCGAVWWCALWPGMIVHGDVISASKPGAAVADPLRVSGDEPALVQAREALGRGDEAGCLAALEAALKAHPELPPAQLMLANLYLSNNQAVKGRAALERAAAALPDDPGVSLVCANLALAEGRLADAWVHYERALGLKAPEAWPLVRSQNLQAQCHAGMTSIAERRGDWPRARQHLEAWLAARSW